MATPQPRVWNRVALIGVGLLGGSVGLALRARELARVIVGVGRSSERLEAARTRGAVTETTTSLDEGVAGADLIVVATPVDCVAQSVARAAASAARAELITDVGSTKEAIVDAVERTSPAAPFVGSHPLAGKTATGCEHATADLFEDRTVFVTPTGRTPERLLAEAIGLWTGLGARVEQVAPAEHDTIVAATSHLPHVVAAAVAGVAPDYPAHFFGSGWRTATRLAEGDVAMWVPIVRQNRRAILQALRRTRDELTTWCEALEADDVDRITDLLRKGRQQRDRLGS